MGEKRSSFIGRTIESLKRAAGVRGDANFDVRFPLPVSFLSFFALRSRRTGGYDSRREKKAETVIAPAWSTVNNVTG